MHYSTPHTFHIPVMGLAYTIDSPLKVARFGISSVISIIEDNLVEKMRAFYYQAIGEVYHPITKQDPDYRARRITDYLNLINRIVSTQITKLKAEQFEPGNEICKYFEMLPNQSGLKQIYHQMQAQENPDDIQQLENWLRQQIVPGHIDVNIMTKLDKINSDEAGNAIADGSDAVAALRGYAKSNLSNSSVILSAGMNPRLFSYMETHAEFDALGSGYIDKKIVVKVSDYRSANIQGKMLAKKGLWVSEFRIESGLNCGGHAFASDGFLLGPILEEFKAKREELTGQLFEIYNDALMAKGKQSFAKPHAIKLTVQGGIGTHAEDSFLLQYYGVDGTGWGTPFLLVPEATTVDENTLHLLSKACEQDVVLSNNSPLGVRFHYLKGTTAEQEKNRRIQMGKPGSPCTEKFLVSNTEFSKEPICTASRVYQKKKLKQLKSLALPQAEYNKQVEDVLAKECLCIGLSNAAINRHNLQPLLKKSTAVNICPGPNIAYFSSIVSLKEMVDHIYGRMNILSNNDRPHMFIKELMLYMNYWKELLDDTMANIDLKKKKYIEGFHKNLLDGIFYYRNLAAKMNNDWGFLMDKINEGLCDAEEQLNEALRTFKNETFVNG